MSDAGKFRNRRSKFTMVSNAALRDPELSLEAKGLLSLMLSFPEHWVYRRSHIVGQSRNGRDATNAALRELIARRYVVKEPQGRDEKGRLRESIFHVSDEPLPVDWKPVNGQPVDGQTVDGKPDTSNTKSSNTEVRNTEGGPAAENDRPPPGDDAADEQNPAAPSQESVAQATHGAEQALTPPPPPPCRAAPPAPTASGGIRLDDVRVSPALRFFTDLAGYRFATRHLADVERWHRDYSEAFLVEAHRAAPIAKAAGKERFALADLLNRDAPWPESLRAIYARDRQGETPSDTPQLGEPRRCRGRVGTVRDLDPISRHLTLQYGDDPTDTDWVPWAQTEAV